MGRQDQIEKGYRKVKKVIQKMKESHSLDYTSERVKITNKLTMEVKCVRSEFEVRKEDIGTAYGFEVYAIKDGKDIDCASDHGNFDEDIRYLLNCYI